MYKLTDVKNELLDVCGNVDPEELDSFISESVKLRPSGRRYKRKMHYIEPL